MKKNIHMPKESLKLFFAILGIFCISTFTQYAHAVVPATEIVAEGLASGSSLTARDEALNRALRNAVEQGIGAVIDSETMVRNFKLLDDRIYSEVKGYVKSYEIISDNKGEAGLYRIKVRAVVALARLRKDIQALGILKARKKNPRIMVLAVEYVDGLEQPASVLQSKISEIFLQNNFPLIDKAQMEKIKARDATLSFDNPKKAASLGRRYGAEVVVIAEAKASLVDTSKPYGVSVFAYECSGTAKAIKVDTAELIASRSLRSETERGGGRVPTANRAIRAVSAALADVMIDDIVESWRHEVYNEVTVQLVCSNADLVKVEDLKKALDDERCVKGVHERSFAEGVAVIDVELLGDADFLGNLILEMKNAPLVSITGRTPNRIDLEFVD